MSIVKLPPGDDHGCYSLFATLQKMKPDADQFLTREPTSVAAIECF